MGREGRSVVGVRDREGGEECGGGEGWGGRGGVWWG